MKRDLIITCPAEVRCIHCLDHKLLVETDDGLLCPACDLPDMDDPRNWDAVTLAEVNARDFDDYQASMR